MSKTITELIKAAIAALSQPATFQADIELATNYLHIAETEIRIMSDINKKTTDTYIKEINTLKFCFLFLLRYRRLPNPRYQSPPRLHHIPSLCFSWLKIMLKTNPANVNGILYFGKIGGSAVQEKPQRLFLPS